MTLRLSPYIVLDGKVKEAIDFYVKALDAQLVYSTTFGDMPSDPAFTPAPEVKELIAHALLKVGESELMFSDNYPGQPPTIIGENVTICITAPNAERAKQIFGALTDGGQVNMPLQETFWSPAYGIVKDKFGVTFQITTQSDIGQS